MKFEDFDIEWGKAFLGNPPYVSVGLANNSVIWADYYEWLGDNTVKFFRKTRDDYGNIYLMEIARMELKNIVRVYNPWSD